MDSVFIWDGQKNHEWPQLSWRREFLIKKSNQNRKHKFPQERLFKNVQLYCADINFIPCAIFCIKFIKICKKKYKIIILYYSTHSTYNSDCLCIPVLNLQIHFFKYLQCTCNLNLKYIPQIFRWFLKATKTVRNYQTGRIGGGWICELCSSVHIPIFLPSLGFVPRSN